MFNEEIEKPDTRPALAVCAPGREFLTKYFDREFDRRIVNTPAQADDTTLPAFIVTSADGSQTDAESAFAETCRQAGLRPLTLRVPHVIGTGMNGLMMTLARGVARGTMLRIRDNKTELSVIHATDIARAAKALAEAERDVVSTVTLSAPPTDMNALVEALGVRIKDKRVGTIAPRWARILYGRSLYNELTTSATADTSVFESICPDFRFADPVEYLKTHVYDNESL